MESASTYQGTVVINDGLPADATLTLRQEMIEYWSAVATKHDPAWTFVDAAGHFHAYDRKGELPTLEARREEVLCDGTCGDTCECDGYSITHWHCILCGEEVTPGRLPDYYGVTPGRISVDLTIREAVPRGRASFRFTAGDKEWFGFGEATSSYSDSSAAWGVRTTTEMACWQVGQRTARRQPVTR